MTRHKRLDIDGGWHHVINRGAAHRQIFFTRSDGERFEQLLGEGVERSSIEIHAYCLMPNHFHLLVHTPSGGLPAFMQRLTTLYSRILNQRRSNDGPVFRGRYRSLLVDSPSYLDCVGRYIHRNPEDLTSIRLDRYRWSSYRNYVDDEHTSWLTTSTLLDMHGDTEGYRRFVERDLVINVDPKLIAWAIDATIAETVDLADSNLRTLRRQVACLMLEQASDRDAQAVAKFLDFPSTGARNAAFRSARHEAARAPSLITLARRALAATGSASGARHDQDAAATGPSWATGS